MKTTEERLQQAADLLQPWTKSTATPEAVRLDVVIDPADLIPAITALHEARWGYLSAITGLDDGPDAGGLQALYHFVGGAAVVTLRLSLPYANPTVASVCGVLPSASFFERELAEMFGVTVQDTPNPDRLFLPDDWPDGTYPLRKDFMLDAPAPQAD